jgi:chaperonin GroES
MATLKPLGDKIIVRPVAKEEKSKAGIILPETVEEKPQEGVVTAVGTGKLVEGKLMPLEVKVGDRVIFTKYSPTEFKIDGEEFLILSESDILAILE